MNDQAAKQLPRLEHISSILEKTLAHLQVVHDRSAQLADRVMGANPPDPNAMKAGPVIAAGGAVNQLHAQVEEVSRKVQRLDQEIARIEVL